MCHSQRTCVILTALFFHPKVGVFSGFDNVPEVVMLTCPARVNRSWVLLLVLFRFLPSCFKIN